MLLIHNFIMLLYIIRIQQKQRCSLASLNTEHQLSKVVLTLRSSKTSSWEQTFQSTQLLYNLNRFSSQPFSHTRILSNTNHRGGRVKRQELSHALSHFSLNCQRAKPFITPAPITPETEKWIDLSLVQTLLSSCSAFKQKSNVTLKQCGLVWQCRDTN